MSPFLWPSNQALITIDPIPKCLAISKKSNLALHQDKVISTQAMNENYLTWSRFIMVETVPSKGKANLIFIYFFALARNKIREKRKGSGAQNNLSNLQQGSIDSDIRQSSRMRNPWSGRWLLISLSLNNVVVSLPLRCFIQACASMVTYWWRYWVKGRHFCKKSETPFDDVLLLCLILYFPYLISLFSVSSHPTNY